MIDKDIWFPVVTLILGLTLKALFDFLSDKHRIAIQKDERSEERDYSAEKSQANFQQKVLIDLQELAWELGRFATRIMHSDMKSLHGGKAWQSELLEDDISDGFAACQKRLYILIPRILDEEIRSLARSFLESAAQISQTSGADETARALDFMQEISVKLNDRSGAMLRSVTKFEYS